ncbi:hypothetical protein [Streptomyces sp. NPDC002758]
MLLRLAYLATTNTLALLRLLSTSDRDKNSETLALRHRLTGPAASGRQPLRDLGG